MRPLISEGHVFAAVPPLYRVLYNKTKFEYLKDDIALQRWKKAHPNIKFDVMRFKG